MVSMSADTRAAPAKASTGYSYFVVWFLAVIYTLNFLDRQIVSILGKDISRELHLSKTEFGLLGGPSVALLSASGGAGGCSAPSMTTSSPPRLGSRTRTSIRIASTIPGAETAKKALRQP